MAVDGRRGTFAGDLSLTIVLPWGFENFESRTIVFVSRDLAMYSMFGGDSKSELESPRLLRDMRWRLVVEDEGGSQRCGNSIGDVSIWEEYATGRKLRCCFGVVGFRCLKFGSSVDNIVFRGTKPLLLNFC